MQLLHSITSGRQSEFVCVSFTGANGAELDAGRIHVIEIQRGEPPPLGSTGRDGWRPWRTVGLQGREILDLPLHGNVASRSTRPYLQWTYLEGRRQRCNECFAIAARQNIKVREMSYVMSSDPWSTIPYYERQLTPDPVSGL